MHSLSKKINKKTLLIKVFHVISWFVFFIFFSFFFFQLDSRTNLTKRRAPTSPPATDESSLLPLWLLPPSLVGMIFWVFVGFFSPFDSILLSCISSMFIMVLIYSLFYFFFIFFSFEKLFLLFLSCFTMSMMNM